MLIGIIGAPNKGKSTLFSALTMAEAEIADYPFTTIKPNVGVAYVTRVCPEKELGVKCTPRNSLCIDGIRRIPVNMVDVAGLVPGAHMGKGMGNQFLNDLVGADLLIQVVDISGRTDANGNAGVNCDPAEDVKMVREELAKWLAGIIMKHMAALSKRSDGGKALAEILTGFRADAEQIRKAAESSYLTLSNINWQEADALKFAEALIRINKPVIVAANKLDMADKQKLEELRKKLSGTTVVGCSAAIELALKKAAKSGTINYNPGSSTFAMAKEAPPDQMKALDYIRNYLGNNGGTGVQELVNTAAFRFLGNIVVYPVEDENKYVDHFGHALPDAILLKEGSSAQDLAAHIHTDLAKNMLYAIDARRKIRVAKDYVLKDNDVIKIVSAAK